MTDTFDFSHLTAWPPSPSTTVGFGVCLFGIAAVCLGQIELGFPALAAGVGMIGMPDNSHEHARSMADLHRNVSQLRYEMRPEAAETMGHRVAAPPAAPVLEAEAGQAVAVEGGDP